MGVIEEYPELARLALLPRDGWTFRPIHGESGELSCVVGWRTRGGASDALWIFDRGECLAMRVVDGGITWELTGTLADCLGELLGLPEPSRLLAPWLVKKRAPGLWTP